MTIRTAIVVCAVLLIIGSLAASLGCSEAAETPTATPTPTVTPTSTPDSTPPPLPPFPHMFYGELTAAGVPAPVGTYAEARVNGESRGSTTTTEEGIYGTLSLRPLLVQGDIEEGALIEFYADGTKCNETAAFEAGGHTELNLTYDPQS